ncbi:MAG TPA: hypothetical protein VLF90_02935 [Patescibacteria group bacterium]|nr:hypothetical protein [Patescibacteria group bacterium]
MPEYHYSHEGSDFAGDIEARTLAAENSTAFERKFQEDLNIFRADVFRKLRSHDALHDGEGWAVFLPEPEETGGSAFQLNNTRDILIMVGLDSRTQKSLIRIIANEIFASGSSLSIMAEDFVADTENDTQYFIDAVDVQPNYNPDTYAPTFCAISNEQVDLRNVLLTFVPLIGINGKPSIYIEEITPFGRYTELEDKIHALTIGKSLLAEVVTIDPLYAKTSQS